MDESYDLPSMVSNSPMINYRKDARKAVKFTFLVAGELGTGKSTFINCLLNRKVMGHTYEGINKSLETKTLAFTLAHSVALPNTSILARNEFDASVAHEEPGIALTETRVESIDEENVRLQLNIIDTPGFGDNLNNDLCLNEIENYLKQQFDLVLAEETRIRRNPRFVDTRVHVMLYFITPTGHGLRELDITCMKRLSKYVNIIPVIGRADSFTESEVKHFKKQIRTDIERFNVPVFQFDNSSNEYDEDEDYELIQEGKYLASLQPFAIIASENDFEIKDSQTGQTKTIKARQYPWGLVDVNNPKYSDFPILKSVLLGSHLQDLKDLTHDFLYETYRTERLTKVTGHNNDDEDVFNDTTDQHDILNATVPSMSNLAQLTEGNDTTTRYLNGKDDSDETTSLTSNLSKKPRSMLLDSESLDTSPKLRDNSSFTSSISTFSENNQAPSVRSSTDNSFKRQSIAPQRNQLRQISETVPYVIRHERILERQHKLEEMEVASAKELSSRAALLEQKAAELKAKEKLLLQRLEEYKRKQAEKAAAENEEKAENEDNEDEVNDDDDEPESSGNYLTIRKEETLTDLHSIVTKQ